MALNPLAAGFADLADVYERGRPVHPPAVVGALAAELGLAPSARVLDLAAGTGKLTRALVAAGLDVVAVEPLLELRAVLATSIDPERIHTGIAEAIPLPDASCDAITVADAFHWFEPGAALREMHRVLRPGGGLVLLSTHPEWGDAPWGRELAALITDRRPEHPYFDGPPWPRTLAEAPGWSQPREIRVTTRQATDPERLLDYVRSMSWVAALEPVAREDLIARARQILRGAVPQEIGVSAVMVLSSRE